MLRKKENFMSFLDKGKADIYGFLGVKGDIFQCMKLVERWSFISIYETCMIFQEIRKMIFQFSKKKKIIFSLPWNTIATDY